MPAAVLDSEDLSLSARGVHLLVDEWRSRRTRRVEESKSYDQLVCQGIAVYLKILDSEDNYRFRMTCGELDYSAATDAKFFALLLAWREVSEDILAAIKGLEGDGFGVPDYAEFERCVYEARRLFTPNLSAVHSEWQKLIGLSREWLSDRENDRSWFDDAPVKKLLAVLRYRNLESRKLDVEEFEECSNLDTRPGTIIGELLEYLAILDAPKINAAINWSALH